jgi:hypothetical protein
VGVFDCRETVRKEKKITCVSRRLYISIVYLFMLM